MIGFGNLWLPFIYPGATLLIFLACRRQYRGMILFVPFLARLGALGRVENE